MTAEEKLRHQKYLNSVVEHYFESLQKIYDNTKKIADEQVLKQFLVAMKSIDHLQSKFEEAQDAYNKFSIEIDEKFKVSFANLTSFRDMYNVCCATLARYELKEKQAKAKADKNAEDLRPKMKKLDVPSFDGKPENWPIFYQIFKKLVHESKYYSDLEKITILVSHLEGSAKSVCTGTLPTEENYESIYNALITKYENQRTLGTMYLEKILNFKQVTHGSNQNLNTFLESLIEGIKALKKVGIPDLEDFLFLNLALSKLDSETRMLFEANQRAEKIPTLAALIKFVQEQARIVQVTPQPRAPDKFHSTPNSSRKWLNFGLCQAEAKQPEKSRTEKCVLCNENLHPWYRCEKYIGMSVAERWANARVHKICFNCLAIKDHSSKECEKGHCKKCSKKHHTTLHQDTTAASPPVGPNGKVNAALRVATVRKKSRTVFLATALVYVMDRHGRHHTLRAFLDPGSQVHIISPACARKLQLPGTETPEVLQGLGPGALKPKYETTFHLTSRIDPLVGHDIEAMVMDINEFQLPTVRIDPQVLKPITQLPLADPKFYEPANFDILLGAELWPKLMEKTEVKTFERLPSAIKTPLGYVVMGNIPSSERGKLITAGLAKTTESLETLVQRFWALEEIPKTPILDAADKECEKIFVDQHRRTPEGKFSVPLPFKTSPKLLGESKAKCISQYLAQERKLLRNPKMHETYNAVFEDYLKSNFMVKVPKENENDPEAIYIPHHGVLKTESTTTPLRIVFNASAATTSGLALNDVLHTGAKLQNEIFDVLLNFRLYEYALTGDISKMYLQIWIHPEHRKYQRIVWRASIKDPLGIYELTIVTFGMGSSPFLALRVIIQLAETHAGSHPVAHRILLRDMYVDDLVTSQPDKVGICNARSQVKAVLANGGFNMTKWNTNHPELFSDITSVELVSFDPEIIAKVLGLQWNPSTDVFSFLTKPPVQKCTKRSILSLVSKIYDPLGFLAPVVITAKMIIKELWSLELEWDERPPDSIAHKWHQFQGQLPQLSKLAFPRHVGIGLGCHTTVAGFSDASEKALGASVFVRIQYPSGTIMCRLLCAKAKVAPKQVVTIPRLELCAAKLLADLMGHVNQVYSDRHTFDQILAFTDSTVTLHWIKSQSSRWKPFVANRVSQIQELIDPDRWFFVAGTENPSDLASRGVSPESLKNHDMWFQGPSWLSEPQTSWPLNDQLTPIEECEDYEDTWKQESKPLVLAALRVAPGSVLAPMLNRVSSYTRLLCATARIFRLFNKSIDKASPISATELDKAENYWIRCIQQEHFPELITALTNDEPKDIPSEMLALAPFLDNGLVRVGGRLQNADIAYDHKHPYLLPAKNDFSRLITSHYHRNNLHIGAYLLTSIVRQKFWIIGQKNLSRKIVHTCNKCFRNKPRNLEPSMAPLVKARVQAAKVFQEVGTDMAGPILVKLGVRRGLQPRKAYICLFTCLTVRAVHLELCSELTTESFMNAFKRFLARRGPCKTVYSDNGTNFVGARNQLSELYEFLNSENFQTTVATELAQERINWKFNCPKAPHFGGAWESLIKVVKTHLRKVVGDQVLTYEEMSTVLTQIEAVLNSRPLCVMPNDPNGPTALTPAHFLGTTLTSLPAEEVGEIQQNRLSRYQLLDRMVQDFWKRWKNEYLSTLQERSKWDKSSPPLQKGTIVLVKQDNLPPLKWPLAVITDTLPGPDGVVRVANIKTQNGTYVRPLVKLCPLPLQ